ncbi:MAG: hypothetical protein JO261_00515 [Alphaproteobacteria bacterium]|nr:hypothetical protein [Alphaproteobacteria bacterium]MBV9692157.1 hypothetical protein [Alphaproteobacteria bacterium]
MRAHFMFGWCSLVLLAATPAAAKFTTLHSFSTQNGDGLHPMAGLLAMQGTYYGATSDGGANGYGTVFTITPNGSYAIIYSFQGGDGHYPWSNLVADAAGNLYGTTQHGGQGDNGTVFKITPSGKMKLVHDFSVPGDGVAPAGTVTMDLAGNFYGTTLGGGTYGRGTIFKIATDGTETVLWSFGRNNKDGIGPWGVTVDKQGNLYGTTFQGGILERGIVFEFTAQGKEKVLYNFDVANGDGVAPTDAPIRDNDGNLFGTASSGGGGNNGGAVFKLDRKGIETTLHAFSNDDGCEPAGPLSADKAGNLYGTTFACGAHGYGTVFKIAPDGTFTKLYDFEGLGDSGHSESGVTLDKRGRIFGTAGGEPDGDGSVFELVP